MSKEDNVNTATQSVSLEEHAKVLKKLEVAKEFLSELDEKVAKYEALDIDEIVETMEKYESLGSVEELSALVKKNEGESAPTGEILTKAKNEEDTSMEGENEVKCSKCGTTDVDVAEDGTITCNNPDCGYVQRPGDEAKPETPAEECGDKSKDGKSEKEKMEAKLLEEYQSLGSISEIKKVFENHVYAMDALVNSRDKMESMRGKLESYESIGTVSELISICDEFSEIKTKQESTRIATELGIPVEKVTATIEKMESVADAEALLKDLFAKAEAAPEATPEVKEKTESVQDEVVVAVEEVTQKPKAESDKDLDNLRQICHKI